MTLFYLRSHRAVVGCGTRVCPHARGCDSPSCLQWLQTLARKEATLSTESHASMTTTISEALEAHQDLDGLHDEYFVRLHVREFFELRGAEGAGGGTRPARCPHLGLLGRPQVWHVRAGVPADAPRVGASSGRRRGLLLQHGAGTHRMRESGLASKAAPRPSPSNLMGSTGAGSGSSTPSACMTSMTSRRLSRAAAPCPSTTV